MEKVNEIVQNNQSQIDQIVRSAQTPTQPKVKMSKKEAKIIKSLSDEQKD